MSRRVSESSSLRKGVQGVWGVEDLRKRPVVLPDTGGLWVVYSPVWTATGTAPSLGNGTITGRYFKLGTLVMAHVFLTMGTTTTFGSSLYNFSLPVIAASPTIAGGFASLSYDSSVPTDVFTWSFVDATTTMAAYAHAPGAGTIMQFVTATTPVVWASGDHIRMHTMYESAA